MNDQTQFKLENPPTDGITQIRFSPYDPNLLLVSSWDGNLRLYDVSSNTLVDKFDITNPILSCCFGEEGFVFLGSVDRTVRMINLETKEITILGQHEKAVKSVCWSTITKKLYSGSWDKTVYEWGTPNGLKYDYRDIRRLHFFSIGHTIYDMDLVGTRLAIAMSDYWTAVYDIENGIESPTPVFGPQKTSLKYMLKAIRLMPNLEGFICSSVEGRIAIEYFESFNQEKKYAFKSHRKTISDTEVVYPVNALAFYPLGTFATGGSDFAVNIWDGKNRKKLKHLGGYPEEISSLDFNLDGSKLAIASSYTFDEGDRKSEAEDIFIKSIVSQEMLPKVRPQTNVA